MCWTPESLHQTCLRASTVWKGPVQGQYFPIWPWVKSMEHLAEHLAEPPIAGSWQLPGITWYFWKCSSEICSIPSIPSIRETRSLWTCHGPVWCASCGHAALGFIMDSDRCCAAPACPQSISQGYIRCSQLMYCNEVWCTVTWHDMTWLDITWYK